MKWLLVMLLLLLPTQVLGQGLEALVGTEADLGGIERCPLAGADQGAQSLARLVPVAEPFPAGGDRPPERLRDEMGVDVYGSHGGSVAQIARSNPLPQ